MDYCGPARRAACRRDSAATHTTSRWWPARRDRRPLERRHVGACPATCTRATHCRRRCRYRRDAHRTPTNATTPLLYYYINIKIDTTLFTTRLARYQHDTTTLCVIYAIHGRLSLLCCCCCDRFQTTSVQGKRLERDTTTHARFIRATQRATTREKSDVKTI